MIDVKNEVWDSPLGEMAILATLTRSSSYCVAGPSIHALIVHGIETPRFGLQEANQLGVVKICTVLGIFFGTEDAKICLLP
jgi:hypothetical protein